MFFKKRDASLHFKMRRVEMVIKIEVLVKPVLYTIFLQTCHRFRSGFTFVCFLFRFKYEAILVVSGLNNLYYLVVLPTNVKKCYGCGDMFAEKFRQRPHNIVVKHVDRRVVRRDGSTGASVYSTDFTNTYYHPNPAHIRRKKPCF